MKLTTFLFGKEIGFIKRINKEFEKANQKGKSVQTKAAHTNTPDARALMGNSRQAVPAKLRRFT